MHAQRPGGGRRFTHQRHTDDTAPIIGGAAITNNDLAKIAETEGFHWHKDTKADYHNRINTLCKWFKDNDSTYFNNGVRAITETDRENPALYFRNRRVKYDLIYSGFNVTKLKI